MKKKPYQKSSLLRDASGNKKKCIECDDYKDISLFHRSKSNKDGLKNICATCSSIRDRMWRESNKDRKKKTAREHYLKNKDRYAQQGKQYRERNKDNNREYQKEYRNKNREELKEKKREYHKKHAEHIKEKVRKWREENLEDDRSRRKLYRERNKEHFKEYLKVWIQKNPIKRSIHQINRRAKKKNSIGKITEQQWIDLLDFYGNKCLRCERDDVRLTKDHIVPLDSGGTNSIDNIQPLCASCNSIKHTQTIDYRTKLMEKK